MGIMGINLEKQKLLPKKGITSMAGKISNKNKKPTSTNQPRAIPAKT